MEKKKCYILVDAANRKFLQSWYENHIEEYKGCRKDWDLISGYYFYYPAYRDGTHSSTSNYQEGYIEVKIEEFKQLFTPQDYIPLIFN